MKYFKTTFLLFTLTCIFCKGQSPDYFYPYDNQQDSLSINSTDRAGISNCEKAVSSQIVNYLPHAINMASSDTFSISFWFKEEKAINSTILALSYPTPLRKPQMFRFAYLFNGDSLVLGDSSKKIINGSWNHIAITYKSAISSYYLNGKSISYKILNFHAPSESIFFTQYSGFIDDLIITRRFLSAADVFDIYKTPSSCFIVLGFDAFADQTSFSVYPNPSTGSFTISGTDIVNNIMIYDGRGVCYYMGNGSNIDHLPVGIYYLKADLKNGNRQLKLVVTE